MRALATRIGHGLVPILLCALLLCAFLPSALAETVIPVSSHADLVNAISSHTGETITLEFQNSFTLGGTSVIKIPLGTNVTFTNKAGTAVVVTRSTSVPSVQSRVDIEGGLTIIENKTGNGSLAFVSSDSY